MYIYGYTFRLQFDLNKEKSKKINNKYNHEDFKIKSELNKTECLVSYKKKN